MKQYFYGSLLLSLLSSSAVAQDSSIFNGRVETNWRLGSERSILMSEIWVPFVQSQSNVFYGNLRLMGDDKGSREGNLGFGYREIVRLPVREQSSIIGVHGWLDRRNTKRGSTFHQITLGGEYLSRDLDILLNGYIPISDGKRYVTTNPNAQAPSLVGTGIVVDTPSTIVEEPQGGLDLEFGWELGSSIDFVKDHTDSLRLYAGGYYFDSDKTENVSGWRVRMAADITSNIELGARFQRDDERGSQGFLEATFRFPFGAKKSYRSHGLSARLDESPERDIDIVTGVGVIDSGERVPVINTTTQQPQEVIHVDNEAAAGGDGSAETPFTTLAAAQAAASEYSIIYVKEGDGSSTGLDQGISLSKIGQQLIGSGIDFMYDAGRFTTANGASPTATLIAPATSAPIITNLNAGEDGISISANNIKVAGVTVNGAGRHGLHVLSDSGANINTITIENALFRNNTNDGIRFEADGVGSQVTGISLSDVTVQDNSDNGLFVLAENNGQIGATSMQNITSRDNTNDGARFEANGAGASIASINASNLTVDDNDDYGVYVFAETNGQIGDAVFNSLTATDNTDDGLRFHASNAGSVITQATLTNGTIQSNGSHGVLVFSQNGGDIGTSSVSGITAAANGQQGVYVYAQNNSEIGATTISNVTSQNNGNHGFFIFGQNNSEIESVSFSGVTSQTNTARGLFVFAQTGSDIDATTVTNSIFRNNTGDGVRFQVNGAGTEINNVSLSNSTMDNNDYGVLLFGQADGVLSASVSNVTSINNDQNGVFVNDDTDGVFVVDLGGGPLNSTGRNRIFGNTLDDIRVDYDNAEMKAENNWWGSAAGLTRESTDGTSSIDSTPFLTSDPQN